MTNSPHPLPKRNRLAFIAFGSAFWLSIAGVVFGAIALTQIERTGERGRGLAIAGIVIGGVLFTVGATGIVLVAVARAIY